MNCPCGNNLDFSHCCELIHNDLKMALSAEMLMRARYSAFVVHNIDFIYHTFHPSTRLYQDKKDIEAWALANKWVKLEVLKACATSVEFKAHFFDHASRPDLHHEKSNFAQLDGLWYYVDGTLTS